MAEEHYLSMSKPTHNSLLPERQALREGSSLRIVTGKEEGTDVQHLPAGVYGFSGDPAASEIPLFIKPYFECFEIHKLADGQVAWVGYVTGDELANYERGGVPVTLDLYPDPHEESTLLLRVSDSRVERRKPPTRDKGNSMRMEIAPNR